MDALDRTADAAAQEAWAAGDWDAKAPWRDLPADRRRSLVGFTRRVLAFLGEDDSARLRSALYRHYEATERHASLSWLGFNGDRFRPAHFGIVVADRGDGSQINWLCRAEYVERDHAVRARLVRDGDERAYEAKVIREAEWITWHNSFWQEKINDPDPGAFVADGVHYTICEEKPGTPKEFRGHAGAEATVIFADGRVVHTTNLWRQGQVPPQVRDALLAVVPTATLLWGHHLRDHEPPYHRPVLEGTGCPVCYPSEVKIVVGSEGTRYLP